GGAGGGGGRGGRGGEQGGGRRRRARGPSRPWRPGGALPRVCESDHAPPPTRHSRGDIPSRSNGRAARRRTTSARAFKSDERECGPRFPDVDPRYQEVESIIEEKNGRARYQLAAAGRREGPQSSSEIRSSLCSSH